MDLTPVYLNAGSTLNLQTTAPDADGHRYRYAGVVGIEVDAADISENVVTGYPLPPFAGAIGRVRAVVTKAITTAGKAATLTPSIGTSSGGYVSLDGGEVTVAGAKALGSVVEGTAVAAGHTFEAGQTVSIDASAVTAFTEGRIRIELEVYERIPA